MTHRYRYTPLKDDTRYFRLLKLLPAHYPEALNCEIETYPIKEHGKPARYPDYSAISYVWGKDEYRHTILCNSGEVEIPMNLTNALNRLRDKSEQIYLWTDSICINQADETGKNGQIQVMGSIYRDARVVHVWLGEERENEAFGLMDYLGSRVHLEDGKFMKKIQKCTQGQWRSLARVLRFEWFERVWTLQEICLATHATVVCGSSQIDWSIFLALCMRLSVIYKDLRLEYELCLHRALRTMVDFKNGNEGPGFLLKLLRTRKCTNDIDRVRGIMSHAFFRRFKDEHYRDFIPLADLTAENMNFAISTELLKLSEPFYTLSLVQQDFKTIDTHTHPSWVPRYEQNTFISTLADETKRPGFWHASGGENIVKYTHIRNMLKIEGVEVDFIEWQSSKITILCTRPIITRFFFHSPLRCSFCFWEVFFLPGGVFPFL